MNIGMSVKLSGGLFTKDFERIARKQIDHELLTKFEERVKRGGRGVGAKRNKVTGDRGSFYELVMTSTLKPPRTKGTSWQRKNLGIIRAMTPRVVRKTAQRISEELA